MKLVPTDISLFHILKFNITNRKVFKLGKSLIILSYNNNFISIHIINKKEYYLVKYIQNIEEVGFLKYVYIKTKNGIYYLKNNLLIKTHEFKSNLSKLKLNFKWGIIYLKNNKIYTKINDYEIKTKNNYFMAYIKYLKFKNKNLMGFKNFTNKIYPYFLKYNKICYEKMCLYDNFRVEMYKKIGNIDFLLKMKEYNYLVLLDNNNLEYNRRILMSKPLNYYINKRKVVNILVKNNINKKELIEWIAPCFEYLPITGSRELAFLVSQYCAKHKIYCDFAYKEGFYDIDRRLKLKI